MWPDSPAITNPPRPVASSYPFLAVSRRHGVRYGLVLNYSDAFVKTSRILGTWATFAMSDALSWPGFLDHWEADAVRQLNGSSAAADIITATKREDDRRISVVSGVNFRRL